MNPGAAIALIAACGAVGGVINAIVSDDGLELFGVTRTADGRRIVRPGFLGNIFAGAVAGTVLTILYTPLATVVVGDPLPQITWQQLGTSVLSGIGGARLLVREVQIRIERSNRQGLAKAIDDLTRGHEEGVQGVDAQSKREVVGVLAEIVAWLDGTRAKVPVPVYFPLSPEVYRKVKAEELSWEEVMRRAQSLRSEARRVIRQLSEQMTMTATGGAGDAVRVLNNLTSLVSSLDDLTRRFSTLEVVRLDEDPTRFRLRKGDRVAWRQFDGTPDIEYSGIVVDGIWQGQIGGGAYTEAYRVQRTDGKLFWARELQLVKLPE